MQSLLVLFLLFGLPFVVLPFGASHFESPKVIIGELLILLYAFSYFLHPRPQKLLIRKKSKRVKTTSLREKIIAFLSRAGQVQFTYLTLLVAVVVLSVYHLFFSSSDQVFLGNAFRGQGTLMVWSLLVFGYVVSQSKAVKVPLWIAVVVLLLQVILSVYIEAKDGRAIGTLGEPNALAAFAVFTWPFVLGGKQGSWRKWVLPTAVLFLSGLLIIFSGSRSGAIALGIQLIFLILTRFISLSKAAIVALILILCTLIPPIMDTTTVYENRGEIWWTALVAGYEHPLMGWGFGNIEVAFEEYNTKLFNRLRGYYVDSSHNFVLDWWVQGGFVGLCLITTLLVSTIKRVVRVKGQRELTLFLGLLTVMLFNPVSVVTLIGFWWIVGVSYWDNTYD